MKIPENWRPWLAIVCAAIAAATGVVVSVGDGGNNSITITVQGPAGPTSVAAPPQAVEQAKADNTHEGAKSETPTAATGAELAIARKQQAAFARRDQLPTTIPLAAPSQRGCRTRMVVNKSSRNGVRPRLLVMHYTVSANRPGFQDVNAITQLFNQPSFAASSNYVIDRDGNCNYIVAEADKAWTQAAGNPVSISWEIINTGSEHPLFTGAGLRKLAITISDAAKRWGIPIRKGATFAGGCGVKQSGIIDHRTFGACGGNHGDIAPFGVQQIINAVLDYRASIARSINFPRVAHFGHKRKTWCKRLAVVRKNAKAHGWTEKRVAVAERYKSLIGRGQFKCRFV